MILSAASLTTGQRCPRRFIFESDGSRGIPRWHPRDLFGASLRQAVYELSNGQPADKVGMRAGIRYREAAREPGIDSAQPWVVAGDYTAALSTVTEAVSRLTLLTLKPGPLVTLSSSEWQVTAFQDESGELHRWSVVERLDETSIWRELHSWYVYGDMAALDAPMTVHFVELGSFRDGRLRSPWCRAFAHPAIANHYRFQTKSGSSLQGKWSSLWFSEAKNDPKVWVDLMEKDNLNLIHHKQIKPLSVEAVEKFTREVAFEANRLGSLPSVNDLPIYRPACDSPVACPWQEKCYSA